MLYKLKDVSGRSGVEALRAIVCAFERGKLSDVTLAEANRIEPFGVPNRFYRKQCAGQVSMDQFEARIESQD